MTQTPDMVEVDGREVFRQIAWRDFLIFAIGEPKIVEQYETATGKKLDLAKTPMDRMIDKATGREDAMVADFVEWVTINHYGIDEAPESYRAMIRAALKE